MGQEIYILIHKCIVKFTVFHWFCSSPVLACIFFLSRTTVMCSTHQLSFAHSHRREETGALWICIIEAKQFTFPHQLEIEMFTPSQPRGDHPEIPLYRAASLKSSRASALGKETTESSPRAYHSFSKSLLTTRCFHWIILCWMNKLSPMNHFYCHLHNCKWSAQIIVLWNTTQLRPES